MEGIIFNNSSGKLKLFTNKEWNNRLLLSNENKWRTQLLPEALLWCDYDKVLHKIHKSVNFHYSEKCRNMSID